MIAKLKESEIYEFIYKNRYVFSPPFDQKVNLSQYTAKLAKFAVHFAIYNENEIIAFAASYLNDKNKELAYISFICVDSRFSGKGYGRNLLNEVIITASDRGFKKVQLEVDNRNKNALGLYYSLGFTDASESQTSKILSLNLQ
ncbi:MAG: GNAT family N-acetyltransferase [Cyclobacteriaceae bacterium]|nr:GNAT family N-acetyltransferase [Cyclobacteriaceae bacterium]